MINNVTVDMPHSARVMHVVPLYDRDCMLSTYIMFKDLKNTLKPLLQFMNIQTSQAITLVDNFNIV